MLKKVILLTHRYLGVLMCLLFVVWFLSGFVMMYVSFPTMKHQERWQRLPHADFGTCRVSLRDAWQETGWNTPLQSARLGMLLGRPVYRLVSRNNEHALIRADTLERVPDTDRPVWSQVVIWLSIAGSVMSLSGIVMGVIRVKRRRKTHRFAISPYQKPWFRWHHYTGFVFGLFVFTWVLSGLFSMGPFGWAPSTKPTPAETACWTGGTPEQADWKLPVAVVQKKTSLTVKELHFQLLHGRPYYLIREDEFRTCLLPADRTGATPFAVLPARPESGALARMRPGVPQETALLTSYDDYYYSKKREKPLPVLRVTFTDPAKTAYYVDLHTGQIVLRHEATTRLERWLYHGLHSFDFRWLVYRRPLWDAVVGMLMTGGLAVSATGLVIGYRWLRRKTKKALL